MIFGTKMPGPRAKTKPHGRCSLGHVGFLAASPNSCYGGKSNSQLAEIHRWIFKLPLPAYGEPRSWQGIRRTCTAPGSMSLVAPVVESASATTIWGMVKGETWLGEVNSVQWTAGIFTPRKLRWQDGKSPLVYRRYIFKRLFFSLSC